MADQIVNSLKFWTTIRQIYRGDQRRLMSSLDLRRFAQASALDLEMTSWDDNQHRNIPEMSAFRRQWLDTAVSDFIGSDGYQQLIDSGCHVGNIMDVTRRLHNILIPDTCNFHCLHCRNNVSIENGLLCPMCGGWYLLEMSPTDQENKPKDPSRWGDVCTRLNPFPSYLEPSLSEDALRDVQVTEDIIRTHAGTCICYICHEEFKNGNIGVQTTCGCGHLYHRDCIERWFRGKIAKQRRCPFCQQLMPTSDAAFNVHLRIQAMKEGISFPI